MSTINQVDYGWMTLEDLRQVVSVERLAKLDNNLTRTAESLGITRPTLNAILEAYEKRTFEEKERIKANIAKLNWVEQQNKDAFEYDHATGMSTPKAPRPIPPVVLVMPKTSAVETDIEKAMNAAENAVARTKMFIPVPQVAPVVKPVDPMMSDAQKEHERFAKLDKTPYSEKFNMAAREQREKDSLKGAVVNKAVPIQKTKVKKSKAG